MKVKTISQKKKLLDKIFSEYIRKLYSDKDGNSKCFTCNIKKHWKELQCGHYISRSYLSTRFNEANCRPQCVGCNVFQGGRSSIFAVKLEAEYGHGILQLLDKEKNRIVRYFPYDEMLELYTKKICELELV